MPRALALAMAAYFQVHGVPRLAILVLIGFHCLLRPAEAMNLTADDVIPFTADNSMEYSGVAGVVRIRRPKTSRMPAHARHQFALVEDAKLMSFFGGMLQSGLLPHGQALWPEGEGALLKHWHRALLCLGISELPVAPASLRSGGATDYFLRHRDVSSLRRRGRWLSERTLERYLQEAVFLITESSVKNVTLSP